MKQKHENDEVDAQQRLQDFASRAGRVQAAVRRSQPKQIANVLGQLIASRGYAQVQSNESLTSAWNEAVGPLARFTRAVGLRRGRLEVVVASSTLLQELRLQEHDLVSQLGRLLPHENITGLKLKTGVVE
jgi:predicted nucleic acid-binding Zn ribbon protein